MLTKEQKTHNYEQSVHYTITFNKSEYFLKYISFINKFTKSETHHMDKFHTD